ncbi:hypothetical protein, partial [Streptomyces sp. 900105245]
AAAGSAAVSAACDPGTGPPPRGGDPASPSGDPALPSYEGVTAQPGRVTGRAGPPAGDAFGSADGTASDGTAGDELSLGGVPGPVPSDDGACPGAPSGPADPRDPAFAVPGGDTRPCEEGAQCADGGQCRAGQSCPTGTGCRADEPCPDRTPGREDTPCAGTGEQCPGGGDRCTDAGDTGAGKQCQGGGGGRDCAGAACSDEDRPCGESHGADCSGDHGCRDTRDAGDCDPAAVQRPVQAGTGGTFSDSVPALVAGGLFIAAACAGAVYRVYGRGRSAV